MATVLALQFHTALAQPSDGTGFGLTFRDQLKAGASTWTRDDTQREAAFIALAVVDWYQTSRGLRMSPQFRETNPLLGERPSQGRLNTIVGIGILAHIAFAYILPKKWRRDFQLVTIGIEGYLVVSNQLLLNQL